MHKTITLLLVLATYPTTIGCSTNDASSVDRDGLVDLVRATPQRISFTHHQDSSAWEVDIASVDDRVRIRAREGETAILDVTLPSRDTELEDHDRLRLRMIADALDEAASELDPGTAALALALVAAVDELEPLPSSGYTEAATEIAGAYRAANGVVLDYAAVRDDQGGLVVEIRRDQRELIAIDTRDEPIGRVDGVELGCDDAVATRDSLRAFADSEDAAALDSLARELPTLPAEAAQQPLLEVVGQAARLAAQGVSNSLDPAFVTEPQAGFCAFMCQGEAECGYNPGCTIFCCPWVY